ncbi:hypothetical protein JCM4814A_82850 [Streptomyces phaeofaciens JCM 4814]|uniref:Uncharacterized protein n=1 Tax=Streptomyces phaeofaciens TaxID=68254 RepID=A0A918HPP3_9ACTN|nr:hypothetical protein [Streptomyces phaeofaciens]GGT90479.1 hypothetical protein GCM10010226_80850 [Streptomyces phaeofaciens]
MIRFHAPASPAYLRVVRASAWYDLAVTVGFVTPWTYALVHDALSSLGDALTWGALPELDSWQTLYANLMGSVVVVWAALRIVRPLPEHGLFDGIARTLFSAWMAYALVHDVSRILWLFLTVEVAWGIVQLAPWLRNRHTTAVFEHQSGRPERSAAN